MGVVDLEVSPEEVSDGHLALESQTVVFACTERKHGRKMNMSRLRVQQLQGTPSTDEALTDETLRSYPRGKALWVK